MGPFDDQTRCYIWWRPNRHSIMMWGWTREACGGKGQNKHNKTWDHLVQSTGEPGDINVTVNISSHRASRMHNERVPTAPYILHYRFKCTQSPFSRRKGGRAVGRSSQPGLNNWSLWSAGGTMVGRSSLHPSMWFSRSFASPTERQLLHPPQTRTATPSTPPLSLYVCVCEWVSEWVSVQEDEEAGRRKHQGRPFSPPAPRSRRCKGRAVRFARAAVACCRITCVRRLRVDCSQTPDGGKRTLGAAARGALHSRWCWSRANEEARVQLCSD